MIWRAKIRYEAHMIWKAKIRYKKWQQFLPVALICCVSEHFWSENCINKL